MRQGGALWRCGRCPRLRSPLLLAAAALLLLAPAARAVPEADSHDRAPLLSTLPRTVAGPVQAVLRQGDVGPAAAPARRAAPLAGAPPGLAAPLEQLLAAVASARGLTPPAGRGSSPSTVPAPQLMSVARELGGWRPGAAAPRLPLPREQVDRAALGGALLHLADAVDRALPALRSRAPSRSGATATGCDVLDRLPLLCVGSAADNVYRRDAAVLVDLGGDDVHLHSAGGAAPLGGLPVALTLDLAGDDRYPDLPAAGDEVPVGLGSGLLGGVGLLVDVAGDDRYDRAGQGLGVAGAGALVDLAGDDAYRFGRAVVALGGGVGLQGVGVLADHAGDDVYRAEARSRLVAGRPTGAGAFVLGTAVAGLALQWDSGGVDSASVTASSPRALPSGLTSVLALGVSALPGTASSSWGDGTTRRSVRVLDEGTGGAATALVAGAALFGDGQLSDAGGDDSTEVVVRQRSSGGTQQALLWGFGVGILGAGRVVDDGGDDRYAARLDLAGVRGAVGAATLWSHGVGLTQGSRGSLLDRAGDDAYVVSARAPGRSDGTASLVVLAQGVASAGAGASLRDLAGADRYEVHALSTTPSTLPAVAAQAAGLLGDGVLQDVDGGRADVFSLRPDRPLCLGTRGSAAWSDCTGGVGSAT